MAIWYKDRLLCCLGGGNSLPASGVRFLPAVGTCCALCLLVAGAPVARGAPPLPPRRPASVVWFNSSCFRLHVGRMACRKTREIQESNQNGRRFSAFHQQISDVELAVFSVTRSGVWCRERNANFTTTQEEEIDSRSLEPKRNQSHPHSSATNGDG